MKTASNIVFIVAAMISTVSCADTQNQSNQITAEKKNVVSHQSPGKPSAPIELNYQPFTKALFAGDTIQLNVEFSVPANASNLNVSFKSRDNNKLFLNTPSKQSLTMKSSTNSEPLALKMSALQDGIHHIDIIATVKINGSLQFKTFAIPVIVGEANWKEHLKPEGELATDSKGRKIIKLKAKETN